MEATIPYPTTLPYPAAEPRDIPPLLANYKQISILENPVCSQAERTAGIRGRLQTLGDLYGLEVVSAQTSPHAIETIQTLGELAIPSAILVVIAGDGGLNTTLSAIRKAELTNPVLAVPGGRKSDLAHQLLHGTFLENPERALLHADVRELRPIAVGITDEKGRQTTADAFGYASVGVTGQVAVDVSSEQYRRQRLLRVPGGRSLAERFIAVRDFVQGTPVVITQTGKRPRKAVDLIAGNGNLMGGSLDVGADCLKPGFSLVQVHDRLLGLGVLSALRFGLPITKDIGPDEQLEFGIEAPSAEERQLYLEIDGEGRRLIGYTVLSLAVAPNGVQVLTTRGQDDAYRPRHRR